MNWNVELKRKSKKILQVRDNYVARPYLDFWTICNWNFCFPTPYPWYSRWTWESDEIWRPYITQSW
jgi:hypothetical protein